MSSAHQIEQAAAREKKRLRQEQAKELEAKQCFYADRRSRMVFFELQHDELLELLIHDGLIHEDSEKVEFVGGNGNGGFRLVAHRRKSD